MSNAIPLAIAGRFLLSLTNANELLKHDHLLSSPLTSYPRCAPYIRQFWRYHWLALGFVVQEGVYLYEQGVDPYSGGSFYHVRSGIQQDGPFRMYSLSTSHLYFWQYSRPLCLRMRSLRVFFGLLVMPSQHIFSCRYGGQGARQVGVQERRWYSAREWLRLTYNSAFLELLRSYRFLLNPYLFLSSLALSTSTLENVLFLLSTLSACRGTGV